MLDRKLLRDCWHLRGQIVSIAAVMACGIAGVVGIGSTVETLRNARDGYYERARLPHVFASLRRAPESVAQRIAAISGVLIVQTRVAARALLQVRGLPDPATAVIYSLPPEGRSALGTLQVLRGRLPAPGATSEVAVGVHFAAANGLEPGDTLGAIVQSRWRRLVIVGVVLSPEFIHDAVPGAPPFGDSRHFGILWMRRQPLAAMYGMEGSFNDVTIALAAGADERRILAAMDAILARYGGGHAYGRKDQPSNRIIEGEIAQLGAFARVMPAIFLFVSAFLLNVVLSRLIDTEREVAAVLKSLGYSNRAIGRHYLGFVLVVITIGVALGVPFGEWLGERFSGLYARFFRFPGFDHQISLPLLTLAIGVSAGSAIVGALTSVRRAVRLRPAEGMRPPTPPVYRQLLIERLGIAGHVSASVRMVLRNVERTPMRAAASILGVALSAAVLLSGIFAFDSASYMSWLQFQVVNRNDAEVNFTEIRPARVRYELEHVAGIRQVELFRALGARVHAGHRHRDIAVMGLEGHGRLRRLIDGKGRAYPVPANGAVLTAALAKLLGVVPGDSVTLEVFDRARSITVPVVGTVDELFGTTAYLDIRELARLLREPVAASGAYLSWNADAEAQVLGTLANLPGVASATTRRAALRNFDEQTSTNMTTTTSVIGVVAGIIALGVIYNGARIALSERARELASLRVLGFTKPEVGALLLGEQASLTSLGVPLGLVLGIGLAYLIAWAFQSEMFRFPVVVGARTYMITIGVVAGAALLAGAAIARRIARLDLIRVLKTRE